MWNKKVYPSFGDIRRISWNCSSVNKRNKCCTSLDNKCHEGILRSRNTFRAFIELRPFISLWPHLLQEKFKKELRLKLKCCLGGRENDFNNDYTTVYNKSVWKRNKTFKGGASNYFDDDSSINQRPSLTVLENNMWWESQLR